MFKVFLSRSAEKTFSNLQKEIQQLIYEELNQLANNPYSNPNVKKLKGAEIGWRLRVRRWRVLFVLSSKEKKLKLLIHS